MPQDAVIMARTLQKDIREHNLIHAPILPNRPRIAKWEVPREMELKINMDVA